MPDALIAADRAAPLRASIRGVDTIVVRGRVVEALGTLVKAVGFDAHVGEVCELRAADGRSILAEVVGLVDERVVLTPFGPISGVSNGTEVIPTRAGHRVPIGPALLGRVLDGFGKPIDGKGEIGAAATAAIDAEPPGPLQRRPVDGVFETRVRVVDALAAVGEGQRVGVFAPAGVGKSTLIGMLARGARSDANVIALVGERGREVSEFVQHNLGAEGLRKSVIVVATSDKPAMERVKCAQVATTIAESFRHEGKRVLLLMDSVTRFARALREIGLASGEPPTRRGFPPSVFAMLPRLLERAGNSERGSITAFYTVLMEGEDDNDPIAEEVRSILDGHLMLSRRLAEANRYPAIDPLASLSRVMSAIAPEAQQRQAGALRAWLGKYQEIELLVQIGEYKAGSDAQADAAIARLPQIRALLSQHPRELTPLGDTLRALAEIAGDQHAG